VTRKLRLLKRTCYIVLFFAPAKIALFKSFCNLGGLIVFSHGHFRMSRTKSSPTIFCFRAKYDNYLRPYITSLDDWLEVVYYSRHIPSRDPVHEGFLAMWRINV